MLLRGNAYLNLKAVWIPTFALRLQPMCSSLLSFYFVYDDEREAVGTRIDYNVIPRARPPDPGYVRQSTKTVFG
jgi:hypothetical protein